MKKINGAILLIVLVMLQIFALISLYEITSATSLIKYSYHQWRYTQNNYQALAILAQVENFNMQHIDYCVVPVTTVQEIKQWSLARWKENGCSATQALIYYYYVIELLDQDPCSLIKLQNKDSMAAFYRISLMVFFPDNSKILLQSSLAIPLDSTSDCKTESHVISSGRQMLRFID